MGAVVQGQALGGIFAAASNVLMLCLGGDAVTAAFADFLIAIIFLVTALIAFIILTRTEFYQYYANESIEKKEGQSENGKINLYKFSFGLIRRSIFEIMLLFYCNS